MDWIRGRTIGRGSSAAVSVAIARGSREVFAVKSIELSRSETLQREQKILSSLNCPQIIGYRGFGVSSENGELLYNLFMEFAPGGSLSDQIHRSGGSLNDAVIRLYTREILLGLEYLHSVGIAHCDVKARNILVTGGGLKIADLGCAKLAGNVAVGGTPVYMAPEVARGEEQGFAADVWALGCTVIEMVTGRAPWAGSVVDPVSALLKIGFSGDGPEIPSLVSKQGKDFLGKCLKRDPSERWSASELLKHPFLEGSGNLLGKGFGLSGFDSPRSVLDSSFLGSKEDGTSGHEFSTNSPAERIRRLSRGNNTTSSWAWDEDWVTVRDNWAQEDLFALFYGPEHENEPTKVQRAETNLCSCGDNLTPLTKRNQNCKDSNSMTNSGDGSSSKRDRGKYYWKRGSLMPSKLCTKYVFCDYQDFGNKDLKFFMHAWFIIFGLGLNLLLKHKEYIWKLGSNIQTNFAKMLFLIKFKLLQYFKFM